MSNKGINIKDRNFILYSIPPKVGKSVYSYIDQIDFLVKENNELKDRMKNAIELLEKTIPYLDKSDRAIDLLYILRGDKK